MEIYMVYFKFQPNTLMIHLQICISIQENYRLPPEQRLDLEVQL